MTTTTVNISFPKQLLARMDRVAKREARSRSEFLREAARLYIERKAERKREWKRLFSFWSQEARRAGVKPADVETMIAEVRGLRTS